MSDTKAQYILIDERGHEEVFPVCGSNGNDLAAVSYAYGRNDLISECMASEIVKIVHRFPKAGKDVLIWDQFQTKTLAQAGRELPGRVLIGARLRAAGVAL